jgi:hypothetical protein
MTPLAMQPQIALHGAVMLPVPCQEERMKKCLGVVSDGFNTIRTGRANPAILDKLMAS